MDRYANMLKVEEVRRLADIRQYKKAMKILDTIDVNKIRTITDLSIFAEIYSRNERYDEAMDILLRIYDKSRTRRILFQLVNLSVKRKSFDEAERYYEEFLAVAPRDSNKYVLRYRIDKAEGKDIHILTETLEKLKEYDYIEEWAYELAKLYHKSGMKDKCVRECSDIILWFGEGVIVEKAKLLKEHYTGKPEHRYSIKASERKEMELKLGLTKTKNMEETAREINKMLDMEEDEETLYKAEPAVVSGDTGEQKDEDMWKNIEVDLSGLDIAEPEKETESDAAKEEPVIKEEEKDKEEDLKAALEESQNITGNDEVKEVSEEKADETGEDKTDDEAESYLQNLMGDAKTEEVKEKDNVSAEIPEWIERTPEIISEEPALSIEKDGEETADPVLETEEDSNAEENTVTVSDNSFVPQDGNIYCARAVEEIMIGEVDVSSIFKNFLTMFPTKEQILTALKDIERRKGGMINFLITGYEGSGKTELAKRILKSLHQLSYIPSQRAALISAEKLNHINLTEKSSQLVDSCLIVEGAAGLTVETMEQIAFMIEAYQRKIIVILEGGLDEMDILLNSCQHLKDLIYYRIDLPSFDGNDLLGLAHNYIKSKEYTIEPEAEEKLQTIIFNIMQKEAPSQRLSMLLEKIKEATKYAEERNLKSLMDIANNGDYGQKDLMEIKASDFKDYF